MFKKKEKYCMIRDGISILGNKGKIKCFSCHQEGHSTINCGMLHLELNKSLFLSLHTCNSQHLERKTYVRKGKKKLEKE